MGRVQRSGLFVCYRVMRVLCVMCKVRPQKAVVMNDPEIMVK